MERQRIARLREEIKRVASESIRKLKDPRVGFVTVTDVELSGDLRHVKIFVSVYGDESARQETMAVLQGAKGFVRTEIGRYVRMRHTPEVHFRSDTSIEHGARIAELLRAVGAGSQSGSQERAGGAQPPLEEPGGEDSRSEGGESGQ